MASICFGRSSALDVTPNNQTWYIKTAGVCRKVSNMTFRNFSNLQKQSKMFKNNQKTIKFDDLGYLAGVKRVSRRNGRPKKYQTQNIDCMTSSVKQLTSRDLGYLAHAATINNKQRERRNLRGCNL